MTRDELVAWFQTERGINEETLREFGVGFDTTRNCITFPYSNGVKERPHPPDPERRRFYFTDGRRPDLFQPTVQQHSTVAFILEGETDTMRLHQEVGGFAVYGLSGINTWRHTFAEQLRKYDRVYVILDNDEDYMVRAQVDTAWKKIRGDLGGKARRIRLPSDVKDVCEFFDRYDEEILKQLAARKGPSRFKALDFNVPPPPISWLLEGWVAKGDVTILAGLGGLGKSWFAMGLAVAVLTGQTEFLGQPVNASGNVLYVDEENPLDVVHTRLRALGFAPGQHSGSLRYLWNLGMRLDADPELLIDEAIDYEPELILLDSLTRLHTGDENASGEIARLFNDAITPLARETGASVLVIHHHDKNATGPRGSTDIRNAADAVIELYAYSASNPDKFRMVLTKSRRRVANAEMVVGIVDNPDGTRELRVDPVLNPLF